MPFYNPGMDSFKKVVNLPHEPVDVTALLTILLIIFSCNDLAYHWCRLVNQLSKH